LPAEAAATIMAINLSENEKMIGLVAVIVGALLFFWYWKKNNSNSGSGASPNASASSGGPAYLETAADNSTSVPGVPEDQPCPGKLPAPGASTEGGYGCK
jgi:hypothetical protein